MLCQAQGKLRFAGIWLVPSKFYSHVVVQLASLQDLNPSWNSQVGPSVAIILEWRFVQICVIYRIKFKLPKHKIPCPGLIYQIIQGWVWLIFSYLAFDQRVKLWFTDLKAISRWIRILILYISKISISFRPPPLTCSYNTCTLPKALDWTFLDTHMKLPWFPCNFLETPLKCFQHTPETSLKHPLIVHEISLELLWNTQKTTLKCL